ncbi:MAG: acyl-CoA/acyl-ACP dehydrogenase [Actinomycetota bacterium]|nr:acyl-CoA/acyl-ACP dehydrogenase [Actinomycetota bacterium]MDQ2955466.1 acyl-CoA/acyl-ACP dehydrogenase [Actinomycetota bacterium]
MDFVESTEHRALRAAVAELGKDFGMAYWLAKARSHEATDELWEKAAKLGFIGINIPEQYGGGGAGITELAIVCEELSTAGSPLLMMVVSPAICATIIAQTGTEEQRQRWLPGLADGSLKMAFAITEPDAGLNSHKISTTGIERPDGGFSLTGRKYYISGVDQADYVLVVGQSPASREGGQIRPALFVVPTNAAGFEYRPIDMEIVSPERQFFCYFDEVDVPVDNVIGGSLDAALPALFAGLNPERITVAASSIGTARYALAKAASYAKDRTVWKAAIGTHQAIAHPLAKAHIETELAKLMVYKAADAHDRGDVMAAGEASNMAKYAAGEAAWNALDAAIQTHGGNGLTSEYGLGALLGVVRAMRIAPVSKEMILNFIAQHSLGLPKSY